MTREDHEATSGGARGDGWAEAKSAVDSGLMLLLRVRYYESYAAVLMFAVLFFAITDRISWLMATGTYAVALLAGYVNRWDERVKQRAVSAPRRGAS